MPHKVLAPQIAVLGQRLRWPRRQYADISFAAKQTTYPHKNPQTRLLDFLLHFQPADELSHPQNRRELARTLSIPNAVDLCTIYYQMVTIHRNTFKNKILCNFFYRNYHYTIPVFRKYYHSRKFRCNIPNKTRILCKHIDIPFIACIEKNWPIFWLPIRFLN